MTSPLPDGWTIERIRTLSQDSGATPLTLDRLVRVAPSGQGRYVPLQPEVILAFHGLCLVLDDGEWYMGDLAADGSITCWDVSYGPDLAEAVRGL